MSLPHLEPTVSAARFSAALSCKPALPMAFYVVHSEMPSFTMPYPQSVQGDNPVWVSGNGKSSCQHFAHPGAQTAKRSILPHSMYGGRMCTMNTSSGCSSPMHLSSVCVLFPVPVLTGETKRCGMGASVRKQQSERSRVWGMAVSHILQCSSHH